MAAVAEALRALAREALCEAGAAGFVRFAPEGDSALLLTDALVRAEDGARLLAQLAARGFDCAPRGRLLGLTPRPETLRRLVCALAPPPRIDTAREDALSPVRALAARWLRMPEMAWTPQGQAQVLETVRLLWRPPAQVAGHLGALRARAAQGQRRGDRSGLHACGLLLSDYAKRWAEEPPEWICDAEEEGQ